MKQQTELMRQILQNKTAQKIIDYVSPIYGDSYVGLWIYEAIGFVLSDIYEIAEKLRYETNPMTTELLMGYWEEHYDLPLDSSLTMEQRRERLLDKIRYRAPANPERLEKSMETVLRVPVEITERVAKNTFQVNIMASVCDFRKMLQALDVLNRRKPAHLIYWVNTDSPVDDTHVKMATAITQAESFKVDVQGIKLALQATLEKAIKMGAGVSIGEQYFVHPKSTTIDTQINLTKSVLAASPVSSMEVYNVETIKIKNAARIAVETAFNIASPVFSSQEFTIEEVKTE